MPLSMTETSSTLQVRRYSAGELHVASVAGLQRITTPVMLAPPVLHHPLHSAHPQALDPRDLETLFAATPELVVLGTAAGQLLLGARERSVFLERGIGLEVMALGPACRTFNVLAQEGRRVAALLFP